jgi:hypothetical protein
MNNGEVTPLLDARADIAKYASSCRVLENMLPLMYGGVQRRPGTVKITQAGSSNVRLIPFTYSRSISYVCEFGENYIRFFYGCDGRWRARRPRG